MIEYRVIFKQLRVGGLPSDNSSSSSARRILTSSGSFWTSSNGSAILFSVNCCDVLHAKQWWASDENHWPLRNLHAKQDGSLARLSYDGSQTTMTNDGTPCLFVALALAPNRERHSRTSIFTALPSVEKLSILPQSSV